MQRNSAVRQRVQRHQLNNLIERLGNCRLFGFRQRAEAVGKRLVQKLVRIGDTSCPLAVAAAAPCAGHCWFVGLDEALGFQPIDNPVDRAAAEAQLRLI